MTDLVCLELTTLQHKIYEGLILGTVAAGVSHIEFLKVVLFSQELDLWSIAGNSNRVFSKAAGLNMCVAFALDDYQLASLLSHIIGPFIICGRL